MISNELIYAFVALLGAVLGVIVPYLLKVYSEPETNFDMKYAYALMMNVFMQVIGLVPDTVPLVNFRVLVTAFAAGYGIQTLVNKAVTMLWTKPT